MDSNVKWFNEKRALKAIEALNKNNMNGYLVNSKEELIDKIKELVEADSKVSCGGSMTLFETGVIDHLRSGRYNFLDRYKQGLSREEVTEIYKQTFFSNVFFTSSNAVTLDGELYNVDGNGNRVAAMMYGPEKVIVICGVNKIVEDLDAAINRVCEKAAPINAKRLNMNTPCTKTGACMECSSSQRICNEYTLIRRQLNKDRIHVIFINDDFGY